MKFVFFSMTFICALFSLSDCLAISPSKSEVFDIPTIKRDAGSPSIKEEYEGFKAEEKFSSTTKMNGSGSSGKVTINAPRKKVYGVRPKCRKCPYRR